MKKCGYCGADLPDGARFCLECMTPLEEKTLITTKTKRPILPLLISCAALLGVVIFSVCAVVNGYGSRGELPIPDTGAQTYVITETDAGATDGAMTETAADITVTDTVTYMITSAETETRIDTQPATEADVTEAQTAAAPQTKAPESTVKEPESTRKEPESTVKEPESTRKETEAVTGTERITETTVKETEQPVTETKTETDSPGEEIPFVRDLYVIQSAEQVRELMIYESVMIYGPDHTITTLRATPSYSSNGWEGYCKESVTDGLVEQHGNTEFYFFNTDEKIILNSVLDTVDGLSDSYMTYIDMISNLCHALGLFAYSAASGDEFDEASGDMRDLYEDFWQAGAVSHSWDHTRDLPHHKAKTRPEGWRGLLAENGLPDETGDRLTSWGMKAEYHYYTFYVTEGEDERRVSVTFELREFADTDSGCFDGAILLEYVD